MIGATVAGERVDAAVDSGDCFPNGRPRPE